MSISFFSTPIFENEIPITWSRFKSSIELDNATTWVGGAAGKEKKAGSNYLLEGVNEFMLIGKIVKIFPVGTSYTGTVEYGGTLFLAMNDIPANITNNTGSIDVHISDDDHTEGIDFTVQADAGWQSTGFISRAGATLNITASGSWSTGLTTIVLTAQNNHQTDQIYFDSFNLQFEGTTEDNSKDIKDLKTATYVTETDCQSILPDSIPHADLRSPYLHPPGDHEHGMSDITSGTLGTSQGGTGREITSADSGYLKFINGESVLVPTTSGMTAEVAVTKVGGGTRTLHFENGLFTGYTDL